jgi:hypothetical protein
MPNTLRRKMFKLGGETNTHGVGLTSGLNYNRPGYKKGGEVTTPIGVGSGKQPMVSGPDGKMREAHVNPIPFLIPGLGSGIGALRSALLGRKALGRFFGPRRTTSRVDKVIPGSPATFMGPPTASGRMGTLIPGRAERTLRQLRLNPVTAGQRAASIGRMIGAPVGLATLGGLGSAAATRAGYSPEDKEGQAAILDYLNPARRGLESVADFAASPATFLGQAFTTPGDQLKTATELISGVSKDKDTPGPTTVPESEPAQMQATQEEAFDALVEDAREREEMYYKMLGEQRDPIGTLGKGFRQLGALYDEDRSKALAAAGDVMQADLDADKEVRRQAKAMAVEDVVGEGKQIQQAKISLMANPQLTADQRVQGLQSIDAVYQYDASALPLDRKGNAKVEDMSEGRLYFDFTGQKPGYYMLINGKALQVDPSKMTTA